MKVKTRKDQRVRRHRRIRRRVHGSAACPRLAVSRSNRYLYAQMIDDEAGMTLAAAKEGGETKPTVESAQALGQRIAEQAKEKGVARFVFDRGGFTFHGRVKAVAAGAEAAGLSSKKEES